MILNSDQKRINGKINENRKLEKCGLFQSLNPPPHSLIKSNIEQTENE